MKRTSSSALKPGSRVKDSAGVAGSDFAFEAFGLGFAAEAAKAASRSEQQKMRKANNLILITTANGRAAQSTDWAGTGASDLWFLERRDATMHGYRARDVPCSDREVQVVVSNCAPRATTGQKRCRCCALPPQSI